MIIEATIPEMIHNHFYHFGSAMTANVDPFSVIHHILLITIFSAFSFHTVEFLHRKVIDLDAEKDLSKYLPSKSSIRSIEAGKVKERVIRFVKEAKDFRVVREEDLEHYRRVINVSYRNSPTYGSVDSKKERLDVKEALHNINEKIVLLFRPEEEQEDIGSVCLDVKSNGWIEMGSFSVLPEYRGKGYAKKILLRIMEFEKRFIGNDADVKVNGIYCTALKKSFLINFYCRYFGVKRLWWKEFTYPEFSGDTRYILLYKNSVDLKMFCRKE